MRTLCVVQFGLRLKEKVKQVGKKPNQPDKNGFIPTTYERTQLTYEEAVKFADSLKIIRRRISESNHARTSEQPLSSSLGLLSMRLLCCFPKISAMCSLTRQEANGSMFFVCDMNKAFESPLLVLLLPSVWLVHASCPIALQCPCLPKACKPYTDQKGAWLLSHIYTLFTAWMGLHAPAKHSLVTIDACWPCVDAVKAC